MIAVEELPLPLLVLSRQGQILRANGNALGLLGVEERVLTGMPLTAFLQHDSTPRFLPYLWNAFQRPGESFALEVTLRGRTGLSPCVTLHSLVPEADSEGEPAVCRLLIVPQPNSPKLVFEQSIYDGLPLGLVRLDSQDRILACNPYFCALMDYHEDQLRGCQVSRLFLEWHPLATSLDSLQVAARRAFAVRRDGIRLSVEVQLIDSSVRASVGNLRLLVVRDLRQQEALERRSLRLAEQERQAIGRELHDALGQNMVALALMADELSLQAPGAPLAQKIADLCRETTKISRDLVKGLAPVGLSEGDLNSALRDLCRSCARTFALECHAVCESIPMSAEVAEQLFRIAQEAVTNAIKHANCRQVELTVRALDEDLVLAVTDDGRGLGKNALRKPGTGLHSMTHRARLLGGMLSLDAVRKQSGRKGCRVTLQMPLSRTGGPLRHSGQPYSPVSVRDSSKSEPTGR